MLHLMQMVAARSALRHALCELKQPSARRDSRAHETPLQTLLLGKRMTTRFADGDGAETGVMGF